MMRNPAAGTRVVTGELRGFKAARLRRLEAGPSLAGVGLGTAYAVLDSAVCVNKADHVPPHEGCACGFYAWKRRSDALGMLGESALALLEVRLWGAFHEFERGFVAAVQQVRSVTVQPYCVPCLVDHDGRLRAAASLGGWRYAEDDELVPLCHPHADADDTEWPLGRLSSHLGVSARWASDADPVTAAGRQLAFARPRPPLPRKVRLLDDLQPGETGYVFRDAIAQDRDGNLYLDPRARLIQPLPGTDVPIRLGDDDIHELLLDTVTNFAGWRPRHDRRRYALICRGRGDCPGSSPSVN